MISNKVTIAKPAGYVVAEDSAMSGWGQAPGRSLFALAVETTEEIDILLENFERRPEMKRVRFNHNLPRIRKGDHLSVRDRHSAAPWYEKGAFRKFPTGV